MKTKKEYLKMIDKWLESDKKTELQIKWLREKLDKIINWENVHTICYSESNMLDNDFFLLCEIKNKYGFGFYQDNQIEHDYYGVIPKDRKKEEAYMFKMDGHKCIDNRIIHWQKNKIKI